MFRNIIRESALTSPKANIFFADRLTGDSYNGDTSLVATLRAIIYPRMGETDKLHVGFHSSSENKSYLTGRTAEEACRGIYGYLMERGDDKGHFIVHSLTGAEEDTAENIKFVDEHFVENMPGFAPVAKIAEFYKSFKVRCFVNEERKITVIIVDRLDIRKLHYIQAAILPSMPWYYDASKGVSPEELELLKSFKEKESEVYMAVIDAIAEKYDFKTAWLRSVLTGFESIAEREEIRHLERDIERTRNSITETKERLGNLLRDLDRMNTRHYGLSWCVGENGESEILEYLLCCKNIFVDSVDGARMRFSASGHLINFDEDQAESVINRDTSFLYTDGTGYTHEQMKKFYKAVFLDKILKIRFCAGYELDIAERVTRAQRGYSFPRELADYMPNPHIDRYNCMGNYERVVAECFSERNYIGVIQQCAASCVSLNFSDGTVMGEFSRKVLSREYADKRYITLPDGTNVTHGEAIAWLESQEENGNEQTAEEA